MPYRIVDPSDWPLIVAGPGRCGDRRRSADARQLFAAEHVERARAADQTIEQDGATVVRCHPADDRGLGAARCIPEDGQRLPRGVNWTNRHEAAFASPIPRV